MSVLYNVAEAETRNLHAVDHVPLWTDLQYSRTNTRWLQQRVRFSVRCADGVVGVELVGDPGYRAVDPRKLFDNANSPPCLAESKETVLRDLISQLTKQLAIIELEKP